MNHVHHDVIVAYAKGAKIEFYNPRGTPGAWREVLWPCFDPTVHYRIKPEPKPDVVRYRNIYLCNSSSSINSARDGATMASLGMEKITIDGETGKLKSVEIVKD